MASSQDFATGCQAFGQASGRRKARPRVERGPDRTRPACELDVHERADGEVALGQRREVVEPLAHDRRGDEGDLAVSPAAGARGPMANGHVAIRQPSAAGGQAGASSRSRPARSCTSASSTSTSTLRPARRASVQRSSVSSASPTSCRRHHGSRPGWQTARMPPAVMVALRPSQRAPSRDRTRHRTVSLWRPRGCTEGLAALDSDTIGTSAGSHRRGSHPPSRPRIPPPGPCAFCAPSRQTSSPRRHHRRGQRAIGIPTLPRGVVEVHDHVRLLARSMAIRFATDLHTLRGTVSAPVGRSVAAPMACRFATDLHTQQ